MSKFRWFSKNEETREDYYTRGISGRPVKIQWQKPHETIDKELWKNNAVGKNFESIRHRKDYNDTKKHRSLPVPPRSQVEHSKSRDFVVDPRRFGMVEPFDFSGHRNHHTMDNSCLDPVSFFAQELQKEEERNKQYESRDGDNSNLVSTSVRSRRGSRTCHRESDLERHRKELPSTPEHKEVEGSSSYSTFNNTDNKPPPPIPLKKPRKESEGTSYTTSNNVERPNEGSVRSRRESLQSVKQGSRSRRTSNVEYYRRELPPTPEQNGKGSSSFSTFNNIDDKPPVPIKLRNVAEGSFPPTMPNIVDETTEGSIRSRRESLQSVKQGGRSRRTSNVERYRRELPPTPEQIGAEGSSSSTFNDKPPIPVKLRDSPSTMSDEGSTRPRRESLQSVKQSSRSRKESNVRRELPPTPEQKGAEGSSSSTFNDKPPIPKKSRKEVEGTSGDQLLSTPEQEHKEAEGSNNNEEDKPPIPTKSRLRESIPERRIPGTCSICKGKIAEGGYTTQWCPTCESRKFESKFGVWTSGNDVIDCLILESQLNAKSRFDYLEWIPFDRLKDVQLIGSGGFGRAYQAIWLDGPREKWDAKARQYVRCGEWRVALKSLDNSENINSNFFDELKIHLCSENNSGTYVTRCFGITQDSETKDFMIVVQYARNGDLRKYLNKNSAGITWRRKLDILHGIATGLFRIHSKDLVHRNLHSGNVLINSYMTTLISDLGLCRRADDFRTDGTFGVLPYVSPEILRAKPYTTAADIYSFGTIMWEMAFGCKPFNDRAHDLKLATDIVNGLRPEIIEELPECYLELMKNCWNSDPFARPSAFQLYVTLAEWLCKVLNVSNSEIAVQFSKAEQRRSKTAKQGSSVPDQIESPIESPTSPTYSPSEVNNIGEYFETTYKSRFLKFESLQEPTIVFTRTYHPREYLAVQNYIAAETEAYNVKYEITQADNTDVAAEIYEILQYL